MNIKKIIANIIVLAAIAAALIVGFGSRPVAAGPAPVQATAVTIHAEQAHIAPQSALRLLDK